MRKNFPYVARSETFDLVVAQRLDVRKPTPKITERLGGIKVE